MNFGRSGNNFELLSCFLYGIFPIQKVVLVSVDFSWPVISQRIEIQNNCVLIALNATLLIGLDFWNVTSYDMYNNLYFHRIPYDTKPALPKLKLDKTYLPKGSWRIFNLSNPWNSKHRSRTLSVKIHNYISRSLCCEFFESGNWDG